MRTALALLAILAAIQFGGLRYSPDEVVKLVCFDDDDTAVNVFGQPFRCISTN